MEEGLFLELRFHSTGETTWAEGGIDYEEPTLWSFTAKNWYKPAKYY